MCSLYADISRRDQLDNTDNEVTGTSVCSGSTRVAHKDVNEGIPVLMKAKSFLHSIWDGLHRATRLGNGHVVIGFNGLTSIFCCGLAFQVEDQRDFSDSSH